MFYAAAEAGNHNAAKQARIIAYSEDVGVSLTNGIDEQTSNNHYVPLKATDKENSLLLAEDTETPKSSERENKNLRYVGNDGIVMRSDPHFRSTQLGVLNEGDTVKFTGKKTESFNQIWAQVEYDGKTGWVKANDLKIEKHSAGEKQNSAHQNSKDSESNKKNKMVSLETILKSNPIIDAYIDLYGSTKELTGDSLHETMTKLTDFWRTLPRGGKLPRNLKQMAKVIWIGGSELYLRKSKGYDFSADLLEHSLFEQPKDLEFYDDTYVADKIRNDKDFLDKVDKLIGKMEKDSLDTIKGSHTFTKGDLFLAINNCFVEITDISYNEDNTKNISIHISDEYDFTKIWTLMDEKGVSLATVANDAGVISTWLDAINPYHVDIYLTIRR